MKKTNKIPTWPYYWDQVKEVLPSILLAFLGIFMIYLYGQNPIVKIILVLLGIIAPIYFLFLNKPKRDIHHGKEKENRIEVSEHE